MPDTLSLEIARPASAVDADTVRADTENAAKNVKGSTVTRVLDILEAVAAAPQPLTPTELSDLLGIPKASIHRLCATLEKQGYLQTRLGGRGLLPGHRFRQVALGAMACAAHRAEHHAIIVSLSRTIGETCNISVPDGSEMIYFDRAETHWPVRVQLQIGSRVPTHCTASGKMFLSTLSRARCERLLSNSNLQRFTDNTLVDQATLNRELSATRERGYATDNEEYIEGMVALAVAVTDRQGRTFATLSFHAPSMRVPFDELLTHLPAVQRAANQLSVLLES